MRKLTGPSRCPLFVLWLVLGLTSVSTKSQPNTTLSGADSFTGPVQSAAAVGGVRHIELRALADIYGIAKPGSTVTGGGIDGIGYAYAATPLGTSPSWSGQTFTLLPAGQNSAVSRRMIPIPAGKYSSLNLLASGVDGNQSKQSFVVTYTDGTQTRFVQSLSDWHTPQHYAGEALALATKYRVTRNGSKESGTFDVYGYTFTLNKAKTLKSFTLPNNRRVVALAVNVSAAGGAPPSGLSYSSSPPLLVGKPVFLAPKVTGTVSRYSVNPALPPGLDLDPKTGLISGTPSAPRSSAPYTVSASNAFGSTRFDLRLQVDTGPTVQLSVVASDPNNYALRYDWRVTDGKLLSATGPNATWMLPTGQGLHFAYVLVGNGMGGYAETRIAVTSDFIGAPLPFQPGNPLAYGNDFCTRSPGSTPACQPPNGYPIRMIVSSNPLDANNGYPSAPLDNVAPGVQVLVSDGITGLSLLPIGASPPTTDRRGSIVIQNVPANILANDPLNQLCGFPPLAPVGCSGYFAEDLFFDRSRYPSSDPYFLYPTLNAGALPHPPLTGNVVQQDFTQLGVSESFFGLEVPATITLATPSCPLSSICAMTTTVNDYGDFTAPLPNQPSTVTVSLDIEGLHASVTSSPSPTQMANGYSIGSWQIPQSGPPSITATTATYQGASVVALHDGTAPQPADHLPHRDAFLAFKGADTRMGACMYYQAIGAVRFGSCDSLGNFASSNAIRFEDWKAAVQIDGYATANTPTVTAAFVNAVDLNLTRVHSSISYGANSNHVAAYVCNHAPPSDTSGQPVNIDLPPTWGVGNLPSSIPIAQQQAVDAAVVNAINGYNLIACVAMDYMASPANGGVPFTRFLIFGPDGSLLPSVNLDGRGEKFVPGACIACHGGDRYAGKYPEDGNGFADVGAHFLPYDPQNFAFSSQFPSRREDQETAIYRLNQNVLGTAPTPKTAQLINGWYRNGTQQDPFFMADAWDTGTAQSAYYNMFARSCRTCHAALPAYAPFVGDPALLGHFYSPLVCGGRQQKLLDHAMPNALTAFNAFWSSEGGKPDANGQPTVVDQPALFRTATNNTATTCALDRPPRSDGH